MPPLEVLYQEFKPQGFAVVGIEGLSDASAQGLSSRRSGYGPARLRLYQRLFGVTFPLLYDGPPFGYPTSGDRSVALLDRNGRVVGYRTGGECDWGGSAIKKLIQILLEESP